MLSVKVSAAAQAERDKPLPLLARYGGAWSEYNTRIAARHSLTQMWIAALPLLVAVSYASNLEQKVEEPLTVLAAFAVPVISMIHAGLLWMHDSMMGNLHLFMIKCEMYLNDDKVLPSYHADDLSGRFLRIRFSQNLAFAFIGVVFSIFAFLPIRTKIDVIVQLLFVGLVVVALCMHVAAFWQRMKIVSNKEMETNRDLRKIQDQVQSVISRVEDWERWNQAPRSAHDSPSGSDHPRIPPPPDAHGSGENV